MAASLSVCVAELALVRPCVASRYIEPPCAIGMRPAPETRHRCGSASPAAHRIHASVTVAAGRRKVRHVKDFHRRPLQADAIRTPVHQVERDRSHVVPFRVESGQPASHRCRDLKSRHGNSTTARLTLGESLETAGGKNSVNSRPVADASGSGGLVGPISDCIQHPVRSLLVRDRRACGGSMRLVGMSRYRCIDSFASHSG
jgi:hypothetical protein